MQNIQPICLRPEDVNRLLASPACLRGRADARKEAARQDEMEGADAKDNLRIAAELERMARERAA